MEVERKNKASFKSVGKVVEEWAEKGYLPLPF